MKITVPHSSYQTPSKGQIREMMKSIKYKGKYNESLVKNIANYVSHEMYGNSGQDSLCPLDITLDKKNYKSQQDYEKALESGKNVQKFLNELDISKFSGNTPLSKAANIMAALSSQKQMGEEKADGNETKENNSQEGDDEQEMLKAFSGSGGMSEKEIKDVVAKMSDLVEQTVEASKNLTQYQINPENKTPEVAACELSNDSKELLKKLAILKSGGKLKARKTLADKKVQQMDDYAQISAVNSMTSLLLPTFDYNFATKQLQVKKQTETTKQTLFYIIDNSGSMTNTGKIDWVKALCLNRLEAVYRGDAELYIGWFERDLDISSIVKISNSNDAKKFFSRGYYGSFNGGSTDIERAVKSAIRYSKTINLERPEIVVINDGQDTVGKYTPEIITHGFILGQENAGMKFMCESSGGLYKRFL